VIDSHCHLADDVFADDLDEVIARAGEAGVQGALCILDAGSDVECARARALAGRWPALRFSVGVHPHQAAQYAGRPSDAGDAVTRRLDTLPEARAIGEIGLDYHYDFAPKDVQLDVFRVQLRLALARDLPIVIHAREADEDTVRVVEEEGAGRLRGVFHCFTSGPDVARRVLALGFHLGVGGIVTFPKGDNVREMARLAPLERLLIETDSPFLAPVPFRGKRNEPAWVARVADGLAGVHGVATARVAELTTRAFVDLFRP
jgi:TatD DNase family protein